MYDKIPKTLTKGDSYCLVAANKIWTVVCRCFLCVGTYVKLKDRKRSLSRKNDHNALWH